MLGIGKGSPLAGRHPAVTRSGSTPAITILSSSASLIRDGVHSSARLAPLLAFFGLVFFGFTALLFDAITQIWMRSSIGNVCGCESGGVVAEAEDEMVKWQGSENGGSGTIRYHFPHFYNSRVFGKPFPRSAPLRILRCGLMGHYSGFCSTVAHGAHLSLPSITPRQNITDCSAIYLG